MLKESKMSLKMLNWSKKNSEGKYKKWRREVKENSGGKFKKWGKEVK